LKVLDFQLSSLPNDFNPADWVEYTKGPVQFWAAGRRITATNDDREFMNTASNIININFQSDNADEKRGFWILYKGKQTIKTQLKNDLFASLSLAFVCSFCAAN
jgi:hypothetical protein